MKTKLIPSLLFLALFCSADKGDALPCSVDGSLSEYGISSAMLTDKNQAFGPENNFVSTNGKYYDAWAYVNPGYGGQAFDAEGIGGATDGGYLYIYLITGFDLTSPTGVAGWTGTQYLAGDIAIDTDRNGTYDYGLDVYSGDLIAATDWTLPSPYPQSTPFQAIGSVSQADVERTVQGVHTDATYVNVLDSGGGATWYTGNPTYDRWIFEARVSLSSLGVDPATASSIMLHWTMGCGNDEVEGQVDHQPVSEPATMLMFGTGLIGLARLRRMYF
ncbi:PEP-CTERM sorting domain-containing protein [Thiovibrio sp. JS02]